MGKRFVDSSVIKNRMASKDARIARETQKQQELKNLARVDEQPLTETAELPQRRTSPSEQALPEKADAV